MIEMQENNSICYYCIDYNKRIDMHTAQSLQIMPLWNPDLRIIDDLRYLPEYLFLQCLILSG